MSYSFGNPDMIRKRRLRDWTEEDAERLRALAREEKSPKEIAQALGRSELATWRKGKQLGVWRKRDSFWSSSEIIQLRQLAKTHTYKDAAKVLNRPTGSVESKAKRLRISFQKYGEANPSTVYTSADIKQAFDLRKQGATLKEIAFITGMNFSHAADILNYEVRYRETLNMEVKP